MTATTCNKELDKSLLRFITVGGKDYGKSTLIERLLAETAALPEAQVPTDITNEVKYRYFQTSKRKFIITDTTDNLQYIQNISTGASKANLVIVLIDARSGILERSRWHALIASLLQVSHLIVAVNKMDLVGYSEDVFLKIQEEYAGFSEKLEIKDITFIPVSALKGDNISHKSQNTSWYEGSTLLYCLENIHVGSDINLQDFRFPVQNILLTDQVFKGYSGSIVSGTIGKGDEVALLPSGKKSKVKSIVTADGELNNGRAPQSVVITIEDEIDLKVGDMIVRPNNLPQVSRNFDAIVCWLDEIPLQIGKTYIIKSTTKAVNGFISKLNYVIDVNTLHRKKEEPLKIGEVGRVEVQLTNPVMFDFYYKNRETGSFYIVNSDTNFTVAVGIIRGAVTSIEETLKEELAVAGVINKSLNVTREKAAISLKKREERNRHKGSVIWLTGFSGAGKSTIAKELECKLFEMGCNTMLLDGDNIRHGLCKDLGFTDKERTENIRRVSEVARLFYEQGSIVICTFISPSRAQRDQARSLLPDGSFFEVFVRCNITTCIKRDPKGLYKKAIDGKIPEFTGITAPYEEPLSPEIIVDTESKNIAQCVDLIIDILKKEKIIDMISL